MAWDKEASKRSIQAVLHKADLIVPGHDRTIRVLRDNAGSASEHSAATRPTTERESIAAEDGFRVGDLLLMPEGTAEVRISLAPEVPGHKREWQVRIV